MDRYSHTDAMQQLWSLLTKASKQELTILAFSSLVVVRFLLCKRTGDELKEELEDCVDERIIIDAGREEDAKIKRVREMIERFQAKEVQS